MPDNNAAVAQPGTENKAQPAADQLQVQQPVITPEQQVINAEVDRQMKISLNGGMEIKADENKDAGAGEAAGQGAAAPVIVVDQFGVIKEKFGFQTPEDAVREIEVLRQKSAAPQEMKFENEDSKKFYQAIAGGKEEEAFAIWDSKRKIEKFVSAEVNKDSAGEIIKLGMSLKFKELTQKEIDYKFNKLYQVPKEPVQMTTETDPEFEERTAEWKEQVADIEMNKIIDAKQMKPELEAARSKLVYPTIENKVDENYDQWQKSLENNKTATEATVEAYKLFTPKSIETKIPFIDVANKINSEFVYEPEQKSFLSTIAICSNFDDFFTQKQFAGQDGKPDRNEFARAIHFALNYKTIIAEAMTQARNATIKASLPDNSQGGLNKQIGQVVEMSELDKNMRASLAGHGGF